MARCPGPIGELRYRMQDVQQGKRPAGSGENSTDSAGLAVELWGFEPQTSSMPWKRATNCAIAPWVITHSTRSPGVVGTSCSRRGGTGPLSPRLEGRKPRWTRVAVQLDRAWALPHPFKKPLSHTGEWRSSLSPTPWSELCSRRHSSLHPVRPAYGAHPGDSAEAAPVVPGGALWCDRPLLHRLRTMHHGPHRCW